MAQKTVSTVLRKTEVWTASGVLGHVGKSARQALQVSGTEDFKSASDTLFPEDFEVHSWIERMMA